MTLTPTQRAQLEALHLALRALFKETNNTFQDLQRSVWKAKIDHMGGFRTGKATGAFRRQRSLRARYHRACQLLAVTERSLHNVLQSRNNGYWCARSLHSLSHLFLAVTGDFNPLPASVRLAVAKLTVDKRLFKALGPGHIAVPNQRRIAKACEAQAVAEASPPAQRPDSKKLYDRIMRELPGLSPAEQFHLRFALLGI